MAGPEFDIGAALALDKRAIGVLVSLFEDLRVTSAPRRRAVLDALAAAPNARRARVVGITGTPGSGKSTLVGELAQRLVAADPDLAVAVLAVDPSSHVSGGALLGDRTRVRFPPGERRLYFRSQASDRELGGVSRTTFQVCRLLYHVFDIVFIETVGIGQSEVDIHGLADRTYLVLTPLAGDQIQFLKAGIMEIPDAFILNKCDQVEAAERTYHTLSASLGLARPGAAPAPLHRTSATTGAGVDAVVKEILDAPAPERTLADKEAQFFARWVRDEYGRAGLRRLAAAAPDAAAYVAAAGSFDAAQVAFAAAAT